MELTSGKMEKQVWMGSGSVANSYGTKVEERSDSVDV